MRRFKATLEVECFITAEDEMMVDEIVAGLVVRPSLSYNDFVATFGNEVSFNAYTLNHKSTWYLKYVWGLTITASLMEATV